MTEQRKMIFKLILSVITVSTVVSAVTVVDLNFRDSVNISKRVILLGDVAKIDAPDNLKLSLSNTKIGEAAPAGFSRFVNPETTVLYDLKQKYNDIQFNTAGAKRCKVETAGKISSLIDYEDLIEEYVSSRIKWRNIDFSVEVQNGEKKFRILPKPFNVSVSGKVDEWERGMVRLSLIVNQNEHIQKIPLVCKVRVSVPVVKASEMITRGETLNENSLYLERADITSLRYMPFTDIKKAAGSVASRSISPGSLIHDFCVKKAPMVKKGDTVYIELASGKIRLSVPARAREDGYKGETIWVENIKTHKVVRVKIKDSGKVSLMEGDLI